MFIVSFGLYIFFFHFSFLSFLHFFFFINADSSFAPTEILEWERRGKKRCVIYSNLLNSPKSSAFDCRKRWNIGIAMFGCIHHEIGIDITWIHHYCWFSVFGRLKKRSHSHTLDLRGEATSHIGTYDVERGKKRAAANSNSHTQTM